MNYLLLIFTILILILTIYLIIYLISDCSNKKSFLQYLLDINPLLVCDNPGELNYIKREIEDDNEVFLIGNQDYTYKQAQEKCKVYDSKLATKQQIINSFNKGADYCLYGWAQDQTAFYPTQPESFKKLRFTKNRFACGLPGVNGGYFSNPNLKFGATCYGIKPAGEVVKEAVKTIPIRTFCEKDINKLSCTKSQNDVIIPFNQNEWSMF